MNRLNQAIAATAMTLREVRTMMDKGSDNWNRFRDKCVSSRLATDELAPPSAAAGSGGAWIRERLHHLRLKLHG